MDGNMAALKAVTNVSQICKAYRMQHPFFSLKSKSVHHEKALSWISNGFYSLQWGMISVSVAYKWCLSHKFRRSPGWWLTDLTPPTGMLGHMNHFPLSVTAHTPVMYYSSDRFTHFIIEGVIDLGAGSLRGGGFFSSAGLLRNTTLRTIESYTHIYKTFFWSLHTS